MQLIDYPIFDHKRRWIAEFSKLEIEVPEIEEQGAVADVADDLSAYIAVLERMVSKKQAVKQGMMSQLLTGKIRLPGFSDSWATTTLGALGDWFKGRGVKRDDLQSAGVRCIRYGELYTAFDDYTSETRSFVPPEVAAKALPLRAGDLLFAGSGETRQEIGKCVAYIGPTPAVAGGDVIVLRDHQCNPIFLALLVNSPSVAYQKARAGQGDAVVHIYSHALSAVEVTLPSRVEQNAIASVVVDAESEISLLRQRLLKARNLKQGMMQELLTGRTRLPVEEGTA
jgi:type I restriction enzyme S subunit